MIRTGAYSSLGGWPVDELKLDMSLVRPIASRSSFRTIVRTTVDLAHQLHRRPAREPAQVELHRLGEPGEVVDAEDGLLGAAP